MRAMLIVAVLMCSPSAYGGSNAAEPVQSSVRASAELLVQHQLLQPLAEKDANKSRFTRSKLPPQQRRVRVLDAKPLLDARGNAFVRFAVDERRGRAKTKWDRGSITGCAYLDRNELYVKKGDQFRKADFLLGKYRKAAASATCRSDALIVQARK